MRLIDAIAYRQVLEEEKGFTLDEDVNMGLEIAIADLMDAPTIEAEPVRHGRCDFCKDGKSFIGARLLLGNDGKWHEIKCCPNCGAKMDGDSHEA